MIRTLFFVALGGSISLIYLEHMTRSAGYYPPAVGFFVASVVLFAVLTAGKRLIRARRVRAEIRDAQRNGRSRAALILERRQTGWYVNEQPQLEFTLLVDNHDGWPFVTTAKKIVSLLALHETEPGTLITVLHPDPEYGDVHIVEEPTPKPLRNLSPDAARTAQELPSRDGRKARGSTLGVVATSLVALVIGGTVAPFLAEPKTLEYLRFITEGRTEDMHLLNHEVLFEPEVLSAGLDLLVREIGHDEVHSVTISPTRMRVDAPTAAGATTVDTFTIQDTQIIDQEPSRFEAVAMDSEQWQEESFRLSEVDWDGVLAAVPHAQELVLARGFVDPELRSISVDRALTGMAQVEVVLSFTSRATSDQVTLDAKGDILASEEFSMLPESEQQNYLFDAQNVEATVREMREHAEADQLVRILNYGHWMQLEFFTDEGGGTGILTEVTYRRGQVDDIESTGGSPDLDELFFIDDIEWATLLAAIPAAEQAMADAGATGVSTNYLIIDRTFTEEVTARFYVRNEVDRGGYVVVHTDGSIGQVQGGAR